MSEKRPRHPADEGFIDRPVPAGSVELVGEGFVLKHPLDERERGIYVRHQERVKYLRLEYQRRLNELNGWYDSQKLETFDDLVSELEAINR